MPGRGLTPPDEEVVRTLRGTDKPVFFVINKIDTPKADPLIADFYRLGQDQLYPLSAEHGIGVAELLDDLFAHMAEPPDEETHTDIPRIAIVGRPNVGKSTLVNSVLGEARVVVSDVPGTTRDPVDSVATFKDRQYVLTDTAGHPPPRPCRTRHRRVQRRAIAAGHRPFRCGSTPARCGRGGH